MYNTCFSAIDQYNPVPSRQDEEDGDQENEVEDDEEDVGEDEEDGEGRCQRSGLSRLCSCTELAYHLVAKV